MATSIQAGSLCYFGRQQGSTGILPVGRVAWRRQCGQATSDAQERIPTLPTAIFDRDDGAIIGKTVSYTKV